jgi:hypothetical protein
MRAITKPILGAVIEILVLKRTSEIYFFKGGIHDLGMKCQNKLQTKPILI